MTDNTRPHDVAVAWIEALRARGVTLLSRGLRGLEMRPKSAFGEMSAEERGILKSNRARIVSTLQSRYGGLAGPSVQASADAAAEAPVPTSAPAPLPARCPHCARLQTECDALRAENLEIWLVICSRNPEAQQVKDDRATAEMFESLRRWGPAR